MRPKKTRQIRCSPQARAFSPQGKCSKQTVTLLLDEIEAIRLADLEGLSQEQTARKMQVHRSTVSRILASAHKKLADAMVHIKSIQVTKGCCEIV